jgi:hypothetical protein
MSFHQQGLLLPLQFSMQSQTSHGRRRRMLRGAICSAGCSKQGNESAQWRACHSAQKHGLQGSKGEGGEASGEGSIFSKSTIASRAPLFCQAGLASEQALVAIRLRSSMHVSRRRRWMAQAVSAFPRPKNDDPMYGIITRPFVAFQGSSNWKHGHPGFCIQQATTWDRSECSTRLLWKLLRHPLARRALC